MLNTELRRRRASVQPQAAASGHPAAAACGSQGVSGSEHVSAQATEAPFVNVIYDKDPIQQWVWGRVVLVGEAAHCTTPHASRSTNMSLQVSFFVELWRQRELPQPG